MSCKALHDGTPILHSHQLHNLRILHSQALRWGQRCATKALETVFDDLAHIHVNKATDVELSFSLTKAPQMSMLASLQVYVLLMECTKRHVLLVHRTILVKGEPLF